MQLSSAIIYLKWDFLFPLAQNIFVFFVDTDTVDQPHTDARITRASKRTGGTSSSFVLEAIFPVEGIT